jgi:hypothetical protein
MPQQQLAAGNTVPQQYAKLGHRPSNTTVNPRHLFGLIAGKPGTGKTTLLATCPSCLIINTDLSSVPVSASDYSAIFWPVLGEGGMPLDETGRPINLSWEDILRKRKTVFDMIETGEPVPDMFAMDSIAGAIQLIKEYITRREKREHWRELDGRRSWDMLNDELVEFAAAFRRRGKGFYFTCHLVDDKIPIGDDLYKIQPELTVTRSTWKRLCWQLELVAVVASEWQDVTEEVDVTQVIRGKERTRTVTKVSRQKIHFITTNREELQGITKGRVQLNDVPLPEQNAWTSFEEAYLSTASRT